MIIHDCTPFKKVSLDVIYHFWGLKSMQGIYYNYKEFVNSYSSLTDLYEKNILTCIFSNVNRRREHRVKSKVSCEAAGKYRRYGFTNGACEL